MTLLKRTLLRRPFLLLAFASAIVACGSETHEHYHNHDDITYRDEPQLREFHVIDTYGTNTEFDNIDLALSPFINAGEFEVFWDVRSDYDYFVELRFNDRPTTDGSRLISSELCGPYFYCDDHQYQFCDYTSGLTLECETSSGDFQYDYIGDLLYTIPQDAYLILQVCDTRFYYCEYDVLPVSME